MFGIQDPTTDANFGPVIQQSFERLNNTETMGTLVIDLLINDRLIRQETKKRGITVSAEEVETPYTTACSFIRTAPQLFRRPRLNQSCRPEPRRAGDCNHHADPPGPRPRHRLRRPRLTPRSHRPRPPPSSPPPQPVRPPPMSRPPQPSALMAIRPCSKIVSLVCRRAPVSTKPDTVI